MEKEENQNTTAKNHQEPEKETAKPEENLENETKKKKQLKRLRKTLKSLHQKNFLSKWECQKKKLEKS